MLLLMSFSILVWNCLLSLYRQMFQVCIDVCSIPVWFDIELKISKFNRIHSEANDKNDLGICCVHKIQLSNYSSFHLQGFFRLI